MQSRFNRANVLPAKGERVGLACLLRKRLLPWWAIGLSCAWVVFAGLFVFAYVKYAERYWRWDGVVDSAALAFWVVLTPVIVYGYVFAHELGHLLPYLPRAARDWFRGTRASRPQPAFLLIGRNDRFPDYALLFSIFGTEVRLGAGLMGWADEPDMRGESEFFVRFMAAMGHLFPCSMAALLLVHFGWGMAGGWHTSFARLSILVFPFLALILEVLFCWNERRTDLRIVMFGKREMYPEG